MKNTLYYGDNLDILRRYIKDESVDLVYLDPPFKSDQNYNVLFKEHNGTDSTAQIRVFEDTWHWDETAEKTYTEIAEQGPKKVADVIIAMRSFLGSSDMMAYLVMMAIRLIELHRILKKSGSIYLHCDPVASHYLKILLDAVFGSLNFRNDIIWKRTSSHSDASRCGNVHDDLLFYVKSDNYTWNKKYQKYDQAYIDQYYRFEDDDGRRWMSDNLSASGLSGGGYEYEWKGITRVWRCPKSKMEELDKSGKIYYTRNNFPRLKRYLDESKGLPLQDVWADVQALRSWHTERLGYPTQKPESLLERIIGASSNEGNIVLDPFCGCGTTITVAEKIKRKWIGIDVTHLAISLMKHRLQDTFGYKVKYQVFGEPVDLKGAYALAKQDRYQFEWWALGLVGARPADKEKKKGKDKGIDGNIYFHDDNSGKTKKILIQVKSGNINPGYIRDLRGTVEREKAQIGVFITLKNPTKGMMQEAISSGYYDSPGWGKFPKIQILTIRELLKGKEIDYPRTPYRDKKAPTHDGGKQGKLKI
jgi:DNA modification methylase